MVEEANDTAGGSTATATGGAGATAARGGYPRLARDERSRVLTGVCGGLGRCTGIDPVVFRVAFGLFTFVQGQGVLLYVAALLLMPAAPHATAPAERALRRWFDPAGVLTILGGLLAASTLLVVSSGLDMGATTAVIFAALAAATAHARGVRFKEAVRRVPERIAGHRVPPPAVAEEAPPRHGGGLPPGAIDLAAFSPAPPPPPAPPASPAPPVRPAPVAAVRRRRSPLTPVTLLCAAAAGAAMVPAARQYPAPDSWMIVMATALGVVGLGLVLGGWFRTRGLATAGTVLSLALVTTSVAAQAPDTMKYREVTWRPTADPGTNQEYRVTVGQGTLDLTALPLRAGRRITIDAEVVVGGLAVTVPKDARVVLDARILLGDLRIDGRTSSGPNVRAERVFEPETGNANPATIVLRLRGKIGDVDVDRG
ncbi:PspC domain-containing protein [Actinomadura algeriensis]|uniref:Phage shock protein PspC (Stress-responsive transcriptional regulator) n=1 Tax=Actinomadura algeriensis TaxID=1679523 RepID=A0ABR9JSQ3_9ACTN|nr:PspC domain-containing protein [Actinomadura algeriensis]MBE1533605.1 phage shock protein PspC (stress-responsive transcriptional regulator) [Actinomadura algeriensis]